VASSNAGSLDSVRLAPHFARDDKFGRVRAQGGENTVFAGFRCTDRVTRIVVEQAGAVQVFAVSSVSGLSEAERRQADHATRLVFICSSLH